MEYRSGRRYCAMTDNSRFSSGAGLWPGPHGSSRRDARLTPPALRAATVRKIPVSVSGHPGAVGLRCRTGTAAPFVLLAPCLIWAARDLDNLIPGQPAAHGLAVSSPSG